MTIAVSESKSTPRRQWDIRGVEINGIFVPATSRVDNMSNPSPTRRSMSRNPSLTRRSTSKNPSPTRRRSVSKAPSPTRWPSLSKAPSPTRRSTTRARAASPRRRSVSRNPSPQRGRRAVSRGPSRSRQQAGPPSTSGRTESRPARRMSTGGPRSRTLPSDSESEAEPRYARKLDRSLSRRDNPDSESFGGKRVSGMRAGSRSRRASGSQMELRSSFTSLDISDTPTPVYYQKPEELHRNAGENGEDVVQGEEVKTIHEVHTRTKMHTLCYNSLFDVSPSSDSPSADVVSPMGSVQNSREASPGDSPDFVRRAMSNALVELEHVTEDDLRKVTEPKLELFEVFDSWSQCSTEQKCLHSVKSVKDIKKEFSEVETDDEVAPPEGLKPQPKYRYPMEDMEESGNIRRSLDEEAARYLEDCVILAKFDNSTLADDISVSTTTVSDDETTVWNDLGPPFRCQSSASQEFTSLRSKAIVPLDDEGMLLPWLEWEPEVDIGRKERVEKAVVDFQGWESASARKSVEWGRTLTRERGKDEGAVNVDEFLFERTRQQPRIFHGRILVCGGKR